MGYGLSMWVIRTMGCFPRGLYSGTSFYHIILYKKVPIFCRISDESALIRNFLRNGRVRVNLWLHDNLDFHNRLSIHLEEFPDSRSSIFLNCQKVDKKISTWALFLSTKYDIYYEALEKTQNFHFCQFFKYFTIFRKLVIKFDLGGLRFLTRLFRCA